MLTMQKREILNENYGGIYTTLYKLYTIYAVEVKPALSRQIRYLWL